MRNMLVRLVRDDEGQDLVEYAMLVSLIALVCVAGVGTFGGAVNNFFAGLAGSAPLGGGS
jgi:pilus assembly protein Flp/PilA